MTKSTTISNLLAENSKRAAALRQWRMLIDVLARHTVTIGGLGVIFAVLLIFVYLLYEVVPLFAPAHVEVQESYSMPGSSQAQTLYLGIEEQTEIATRFSDNGEIHFFKARSGELVSEKVLPLPAGQQITAHTVVNEELSLQAFGLDDGQVLLARPFYRTLFGENLEREIRPELRFPYGEGLLEARKGVAIESLALQESEEQLTIATEGVDGQLWVTRYTKTESFFSDELTLEFERQAQVPFSGAAIEQIQLDISQRWLFIADADGYLTAYDLADLNAINQIDQVAINASGEILGMRMLLGGISLLISDSSGNIGQWFPARHKSVDANGDPQVDYYLANVRNFSDEKLNPALITPEHRRKGFLVAGDDGYFSIFYTTSQRRLLTEQVLDGDIRYMAVAPRGNAALVATADQVAIIDIHNEHPEVSFSALWSEVWYENYDESQFSWQSSAATNDFEPKFSLVPLTFGTIKAAFYAMLLAIPLAIMGAIFTAYFMSAKMRQFVKPTIELMEALPTVILGFLAGLWLAPLVEDHLASVLGLIVIVPVGVMIFAYLWSLLPSSIRHLVPEGWQAAVLVPVVILLGMFTFAIGDPIEAAFFDGQMSSWLESKHGIGLPYDQRNALIVGVAMGFAVIPTIFSITEDAIFGVPKHLSYGSLALGATPWQTLVRVVLPTASPGIFSATMIGFGRAVGETMIVLMATGNTPIMDINIFEGMRTLSANIAVEMPEAEVDSSHFRILFLTALVLFAFTFVVNTLSELVRHRLRQRYGSL